MKKWNNAFTLVELIVVITILAILGTIAFLSFQGYSKSARDSSRITDINSAETALELYALQTGYYPEPTNSTPITFSGSEVWTQGTIGDSLVLNLQRLSKKPVDPLTGSEYTYSRLNTKNEYELATVLENDEVSYFPQSYAGEKIGSAYVEGNYNGMVARVNTGSITYVLAVPTIISGDMSVTDIILLQQGNKLVYKGLYNHPASYTGSVFNVFGGGFTYDPNTIIVYSGSLDSLKNIDDQMIFIKNLQDIYGATQMPDLNDEIKRLVNTVIDQGNPSSEAQNFASGLISNNINGDVKITQIPTGTGGGGGVDVQEITGVTAFDNFDGELITIHPYSDGSFNYDNLSTYQYTYTLWDGEIIGFNFDGSYFDMNAYGGLNEYEEVGNFINGNTINPTNFYSDKVTIYAIFLDQEDIKIKIKDNTAPLGSCGTQPNYINTIFTIGSPITDNEAWQNSNSLNPCYYECTLGYTGNDCSTPPGVTDESYFTFNELTQTITDYDTNGGPYLTIPSTINGIVVKNIGYSAFFNKSLQSVVIPEGITSITTGGFAYNKIVNLQIPNSMTSIASDAFSLNYGTLGYVINYDGVASNEYIYFPKGGGMEILSYFGTDTDLTIPDSINGLNITTFGDSSFRSQSLTNVTIPDTVTNIGKYAFRDNSLTSINLPSSLITIGQRAFELNSLTSINIPNSTTNVGPWAFIHNSLTNIVIPSSDTIISTSAFTLQGSSVGGGTVTYSSQALKDTYHNSSYLDIVKLPNFIVQ